MRSTFLHIPERHPGIQRRSELDHVRSRVQAGDNLAGLAAEVRTMTAGAFEFLEQGLRGYAAEPAAAAGLTAAPAPGPEHGR